METIRPSLESPERIFKNETADQKQDYFHGIDGVLGGMDGEPLKQLE